MECEEPMTDEEALELGKRWAALGLPWMPGMKITEGDRLLSFLPKREGYGERVMWALGGLPYYEEDLGFFDSIARDDIPDFRDPATLGCLLAQVRERLGDPGIHTMRYDYEPEEWRAWHSFSVTTAHCGYEGSTEAEALVAALEAAQ